MVVNGYTYTKHRVNKDVFQWHCVERKRCRARMNTIGAEVIKMINEYTHEHNSKLFLCKEVKAGRKRKGPTHSIFASKISELDEESAVITMPTTCSRPSTKMSAFSFCIFFFLLRIHSPGQSV